MAEKRVRSKFHYGFYAAMKVFYDLDIVVKVYLTTSPYNRFVLLFRECPEFCLNGSWKPAFARLQKSKNTNFVTVPIPVASSCLTTLPNDFIKNFRLSFYSIERFFLFCLSSSESSATNPSHSGNLFIRMSLK